MYIYETISIWQQLPKAPFKGDDTKGSGIQGLQKKYAFNFSSILTEHPVGLVGDFVRFSHLLEKKKVESEIWGILIPKSRSRYRRIYDGFRADLFTGFPTAKSTIYKLKYLSFFSIKNMWN